MPGMVAPRCGSLASSGLPVVVWSPDTTHEFEPMPSPWPSSCGRPLATFWTESRDFSRSCVSIPRRASAAIGEVVNLPSWPTEPRGHDRLVPVVRVLRVEALDVAGRERREQLGPGDLLVHVAAEVPRHRLQPGQRVRRGPRLRAVVGALQRQYGVLEAEAGSAVRGQVRVHAAGVVVQVLPGGRAEQAAAPSPRPGASRGCGRTCPSPVRPCRTARSAGRR